jgi:hypothetical protein
VLPGALPFSSASQAFPWLRKRIPLRNTAEELRSRVRTRPAETIVAAVSAPVSTRSPEKMVIVLGAATPLIRIDFPSARSNAEFATLCVTAAFGVVPSCANSKEVTNNSKPMRNIRRAILPRQNAWLGVLVEPESSPRSLCKSRGKPATISTGRRWQKDDPTVEPGASGEASRRQCFGSCTRGNGQAYMGGNWTCHSWAKTSSTAVGTQLSLSYGSAITMTGD